jgi:hypothetical protein
VAPHAVSEAPPARISPSTVSAVACKVSTAIRLRRHARCCCRRQESRAANREMSLSAYFGISHARGPPWCLPPGALRRVESRSSSAARIRPTSAESAAPVRGRAAGELKNEENPVELSAPEGEEGSQVKPWAKGRGHAADDAPETRATAPERGSLARCLIAGPVRRAVYAKQPRASATGSQIDAADLRDHSGLADAFRGPSDLHGNRYRGNFTPRLRVARLATMQSGCGSRCLTQPHNHAL